MALIAHFSLPGSSIPDNKSSDFKQAESRCLCLRDLWPALTLDANARGEEMVADNNYEQDEDWIDWLNINS